MQTEIQKSLKVLQEGKILLYPTDTVWGIGCDATCEKAVSKIFSIKKREESKSLIILVSNLQMLQQYIPEIPKKVLEIASNALQPTTIIYNNPKGLAKNVVALDNSVAIRLVNHNFCKQLINAFGKPIVSTSANVSGDQTPSSFSEINKSILDSADYVVNLDKNINNPKSSTILKVAENGDIIVLRP